MRDEHAPLADRIMLDREWNLTRIELCDCEMCREARSNDC